LNEYVEQAYQDSFDLYTDDNPQSLVDLVQQVFSCCGVNSYADYINKSVQIPLLEGCSVVVPEKINEKFVIITGGIALGAGAAMVSIWLCDAIMLT